MDIDRKILERAAKLLRLSDVKNGGTEAEAQLAGERFADLAREYGLTQAQVLADGGEGDRRVRNDYRVAAGSWWQPPLMREICRANFVHCEHVKAKDKAGRLLGAGYDLIGREEAVASCRVLYEYLVQTVVRCGREYVQQCPTGIRKRFERGMSERLQERIEMRHRKTMKEEKERAETAQAAYASGEASTALVVTLVNYRQKEKDLNEDYRLGLPPGTTQAEREADDRRWEESKAKRRAKCAAALASLIAESIAEELARLIAEEMSWGVSREKAEEEVRKAQRLAAAPPREETEAQRAKREEKERRDEARREERWQRERSRKWADPSWQAGERAGERVSLDKQVDRTEPRKLG